MGEAVCGQAWRLKKRKEQREQSRAAVTEQHPQNPHFLVAMPQSYPVPKNCLSAKEVAMRKPKRGRNSEFQQDSFLSNSHRVLIRSCVPQGLVGEESSIGLRNLFQPALCHCRRNFHAHYTKSWCPNRLRLCGEWSFPSPSYQEAD